MSGCLKESSGRVLIFLKVVPRASRTEIASREGPELRLRVTAPPVDSAANQAVLDFLAEKLAVPRGQVGLIRGATHSRKTVSLTGISLAEVELRLGVKSSQI